jgi:hypothetical protein
MSNTLKANWVAIYSQNLKTYLGPCHFESTTLKRPNEKQSNKTEFKEQSFNFECWDSIFRVFPTKPRRQNVSARLTKVGLLSVLYHRWSRIINCIGMRNNINGCRTIASDINKMHWRRRRGRVLRWRRSLFI